MPHRNNLQTYFFEVGTPSNMPTKTIGKIFQNALKLHLLYENFNKFLGMHGPKLPKDGFVHKLLQMDST